MSNVLGARHMRKQGIIRAQTVCALSVLQMPKLNDHIIVNLPMTFQLLYLQ